MILKITALKEDSISEKVINLKPPPPKKKDYIGH